MKRSLLGKMIFSLSLMACPCSYADSPLLTLLAITPSTESEDYVNNKKQFQLYSLVTEQRHPQTMRLSYQIAQDTTAGLRSLLAVDQDITKKFNSMAADPEQLKILEGASQAIQSAILNGHKIYFYGTGSTGRLAEAVESSLWRPFWEKLAQSPQWAKVKDHFPDIQNRLKGEITGGDRALISSLEGFEDLQVIGKLQLADNKIQKDDVVFAATEGGETSAVIGTILAAAEFYPDQSTKNLYFVYNNPDAVLRPFDRSRTVLDNPRITKINVTTGPQSISGSTRMQATTSSLYVCGIILEDAIYRLLQPYLSKEELRQLGFSDNLSIKQQLLDFGGIQKIIYNSAAKIAPWTDLEAQTYANQRHTTYFAQKALLPVFVDVTERAPTFRLQALDRADAASRQSWIQVWSPAETASQAWDMLLHRPFHGLNANFYQADFNQIQDPYLKKAALNSLNNAGAEQQNFYDLAFSKANVQKFGPTAGDLGVMILLPGETLTERFKEWLQLFANAKANLALVSVARESLPNSDIQTFKNMPTKNVFLQVLIPRQDPFELSQIIGLKMLLNANSTAVMAKLGRVVGNTMTDVAPGNLKLIGRATYLIQVHVNAALKSNNWVKAIGKTQQISFADANAVLFDAIHYVQSQSAAPKTSEVALAIVRILESLKHHKNISWEQAEKILDQQTLAQYLAVYEK
jgi:N-acetylmuramic acid 6-phosphate etherase